ncbi:hypothetical protein FACS1894178_0590 [Bacteroidia bacterium]|nr:hypothetical protein FACS1894178_0590 [Bacteroidia bacterium]
MSFSNVQIVVLTILRFFACFTILVLLLSLFVRIEKKEVRKPDLVLLHDNSESLKNIKNQDEWLKNWMDFSKQLEKKYNIIHLNFGKNISSENEMNFSEKNTDISNALQEVRKRYGGKNLSALVLASDGIITSGEHPIAAVQNISVPIYSIALGDTTTFQDLFIQNIDHNRYAYLGNQSTVEINIAAKKAANTKANVSLFQDNKIIANQEVIINDNNFFDKITFKINADKLGIAHYSAKISANIKERNSKNNTAIFSIEVLNNKKKILLMAANPNPDVAALRQIIENNDKYELDFFGNNGLQKALGNYDLVVTHNLPSFNNIKANALFTEALGKNIPCLIFLGNSSDFNAFNKLSIGLNIHKNNTPTNEAYAIVNQNFANFQVSENIKNNFAELPPLELPSAKFLPSEGSATLLFQRILNVNTDMPVLLFSQKQGTRFGIFIGDGFWRWRLHDYLLNNNHENIDEFVRNIVQYLSASKDKQLFSSNIKSIYDENEEIIVDAEIYDDAFEAINDAEIEIEVANADKNTFQYAFSNKGNYYSANLGHLPAGKYQYNINADYKNTHKKLSGSFLVESIDIEQVNLQANHQLLNMISSESNGKMLYPDQLNDLEKRLVESDAAKPVALSSVKYFDLINLPFIFAVICLLLVVEWFLRRFWGNY